jgi:hypothetical protein
MGEIGIAYMILTRKPEGNSPLQRLELKQEDNIKSYLNNVFFADWLISLRNG